MIIFSLHLLNSFILLYFLLRFQRLSETTHRKRCHHFSHSNRIFLIPQDQLIIQLFYTPFRFVSAKSITIGTLCFTIKYNNLHHRSVQILFFRLHLMAKSLLPVLILLPCCTHLNILKLYLHNPRML